MAGEASRQRPTLYTLVCCIPSWPPWRLLDYRPVSQERLGWAWETHRLLCSHCLQGCWSSCGPWWKTPRMLHQGYSLYSPCPRLSRHPLGSGDPGRKERGHKVVAHGFLGHYG